VKHLFTNKSTQSRFSILTAIKLSSQMCPNVE